MANIARLGVVFGIDTAQFVSGLESAKKSVNSFAQDQIPKLKVGLTIGAAAFTAMAHKVLEMSDRISDLADAADMSIASVLSISEAIEQSGGKSDSAGKALIKFTENIDKAALGSKELQDQFKRIGVSLEDLSKLSGEDLFKKSVDGVANLGDVATRTGAKMALFGKGMRDVDMTKFNEEVKHGSAEFEQYANAVAIAGELNDKLAKKANLLALAFTKEVMPAINGMFESLASKGGMAETVFVGLRYAVSAIWLVLEGIKSTAEAIKLTFSSLTSLENLKQWSEKMDAIGEKSIETEKKIMEFMRGTQPQETPKPKGNLPPRTVTPAKDPEAEKLALMLGMAQKISKEYEDRLIFSNEMIGQQKELLFLTDDERKVQEAINQVLNQTEAKVLEIEKKKEEARLHGGNKQILDEYDAQIEKVKELGAKYGEMALNQTLATNEVQRTFEFGWNKAFRQFGEDATNYATLAKDMFQSMTGAMGKAIDNFVDNGKFSFSDFAASVIKDIIKIQLKMQAAQLFQIGIKAVAGAFTAGSGATTIGEGSLAGGEGALSFPITNGYSGRATGGEITSPSIVGERGPELFIPDRSGAIIPNRNIGDYMGGGGGVTYNGTVIQNMQAIDTQSGLQFLAKNKMNIYAINQSASRSMPTSR